MLAMRCRLAQAVLVVTCCLVGKLSLHAQTPDSTSPVRIENEKTCAASSLDDQPAGSGISVAEVTFSGDLELPLADQDQIATSIKQQGPGDSIHGVTDEAVERVKAGWQNHGYYKVRVRGEAKTLASAPGSQRIALTFNVDEGLQYSLGKITFKHNKVLTDVGFLRALFPIRDGDIVSREKIAKGLENLRMSYGDLGYLNFTAIPNTKVHDQARLISLNIDVDEDKQFHLDEVSFLGLDETVRQDLMKDFPLERGQVYNSTVVDQFLLRHSSMFPDCPCGNQRSWELKQNTETGTIDLNFDFRPCTDN
jgi:hypothetical protein